MIAIIDYGVGNLFSLLSSFKFIGQQAVITRDIAEIEKSDRILLPGVGAFDDAAKKLRDSGMAEVVKAQAATGKPLLGICLGMQMLLEKSYEYGEHDGLGLIKGAVKPIAPVISSELKVPHIGWNALHFPTDKPKSEIFKYVDEGEHVYFVHSFAAFNCEKSVIATTEYDAQLTAAVGTANIFGTQFHPEKSGDTGLRILKAFCEI